MIDVGIDVDEACMTALYLERTAKIQAFSHLLKFWVPIDEFIESINATWEKLQARSRELCRGAPATGR